MDTVTLLDSVGVIKVDGRTVEAYGCLDSCYNNHQSILLLYPSGKFFF